MKKLPEEKKKKGPYFAKETAVKTRKVSTIRKGLVRTSDVSKYLKTLERRASQKKKET